MSGFPSKTLKACAIKPPTSIDQIPFQMLLILDEQSGRSKGKLIKKLCKPILFLKRNSLRPQTPLKPPDNVTN